MRYGKSLFFILSAVMMMTGCSKDDGTDVPRETNLQQQVVVTRDPDHGAKASSVYRFEFKVDGTWSIYQGESPLTIDMTTRVGYTTEREFMLDGFDAETRYYFRLVRDGSETAVVSEVQLPFEGQRNFRDLGGTVMADGRKIRWGAIYRSGDLSELTPVDRAYFNSLGVTKVIDFRSDEEVAQAPDKLPEGMEVIRLPIDDTLISQDLILGWLRNQDTLALDTLLDHVYTRFVTHYHDQFSLFLQQLENADGPIVFHCTEGKDRAGWAATLFLAALGADKETIYENYMASNRYLKERIEKTIQMVNLAGLNGELLRPILEVDTSYLERAISLVEKEYGSLENYLIQQMGVHPLALRSLYLE